MTTAALDWSTAFAPGFDGVVCVLFEGVPILLTPSGIRPTGTRVTPGRSTHPLWWPGTNSLDVDYPPAGTLNVVRDWLDAAASMEVYETTLPGDGTVSVEALRFDLFDAGGEATAILSARDARTVRGLTSDIPSPGNVPLDSVAGVASAGLLHIGREYVGYGSLSGLDAVVSGAGAGRGRFGSRARAHVVGSGSRRPLVVVSDYPRSWTGRLASVWLCGLEGAERIRRPTQHPPAHGSARVYRAPAVRSTRSRERWRELPGRHLGTKP